MRIKHFLKVPTLCALRNVSVVICYRAWERIRSFPRLIPRQLPIPLPPSPYQSIDRPRHAALLPLYPLLATVFTDSVIYM
jgi:hypothetical protein